MANRSSVCPQPFVAKAASKWGILAEISRCLPVYKWQNCHGSLHACLWTREVRGLIGKGRCCGCRQWILVWVRESRSSAPRDGAVTSPVVYHCLESQQPPELRTVMSPLICYVTLGKDLLFSGPLVHYFCREGCIVKYIVVFTVTISPPSGK
jgi:hypothetical protein